MDAKEIRARLLTHTQFLVKIFDNTKFLDMSRLGECPRKLTWEMLHGVNPGDDLKMRLFKIHQAEEDLQQRLTRVLSPEYTGTRPIQAMKGRVVGFTSGEFRGMLIKIKSVPDDDALPNGRAPNNHYWMAQALMHFGHFANCILIYESRATGRIRTYDQFYNPAIGEDCERKARLVLASVDKGKLPKCNCGKCDEHGYVEK
ncbi:MAG TPA: hypothetical protein PKZ83_17385 [bacterium]|nr:hypothetical protein [bacterium]HQJ66279.1 hypothetical protein [bacterium]